MVTEPNYGVTDQTGVTDQPMVWHTKLWCDSSTMVLVESMSHVLMTLMQQAMRDLQISLRYLSLYN